MNEGLLFMICYLVAGGVSCALARTMFRDVEADPVASFLVVFTWPVILPVAVGFWTMKLILRRNLKR